MSNASDSRSIANEPWYQRPLVYIGFTVVSIAVFVALIATSSSSFSLQQRLWQVVGLLVACGLATGGYLTVLGAKSAKKTEKEVVQATLVFDSICFTVGGLVVVSFANPGDPLRWAATIMWALSCLAIGAFAGFLFGIPRSRREGQTAAPTPAGKAPAQNQTPSRPNPSDASASKVVPPAPGSVSVSSTVASGASAQPSADSTGQQTGGNPAAGDSIPVQGAVDQGAGGQAMANDTAGQQADGDPPARDNVAAQSMVVPTAGDPSPIEQISDWLTKIIVGLGLVNLGKLPPLLGDWAKHVAMSIGPLGSGGKPDPSVASLATGMILYFLILGFMACYILTQVFLRNLVNQSNAPTEPTQ